MPSILVLALIGCTSHFSDVDTEPQCTPYAWFLDADGDGYGDPETTAIQQCTPDDATGFVVSNNSDCDDSDASITAAGPSCPADLAGGASIIQFSLGTHEYLVTNTPDNDPTDGSGVVGPDEAEAACAAWGGALFVADDAQEAGVLNDHVASTWWAGWVGVSRGTGGWAWDGGAAVDPFCDGDATVPDDAALTHLAWVKRDLIEDPLGTCIGLPDHVVGVYTNDVVTGVDTDGDGLPNSVDPDPSDFDSDDDGVGDGQEVDVVGTDPESADAFPVLEPVADPQLAYQADLAFFACERERPAP